MTLRKLEFLENFMSSYRENGLAEREGAEQYIATQYCEFALATRRPFLGVSSLNLAAPSGAAFFIPRLSALV